VLSQVDEAAPEAHTFLEQPHPLRNHAFHPRADADPAPRVDDAMPGQRVRTSTHRMTDGARAARGAEQRRHLPVRHH
jgi:hypothetical protein